MFTLASQQLADALKVLRNDAIKGYGSGLSGAIKDSASAFSQIAASVRTLSGAISVDRTIQKDVISSALKCLDSAIDSIAVHRALAADHVLGSNQVAAERSYFAFESTLADLRAVISGNVIGLLKEAIALLTEARAAFIGDELTAATISVIDVALALKSMALAIILVKSLLLLVMSFRAHEFYFSLESRHEPLVIRWAMQAESPQLPAPCYSLLLWEGLALVKTKE